MSHLLAIQVKAVCRWASVLLCMVFISGCVASTRDGAKGTAENQNTSLLRKVVIHENDDKTDLVLYGDGAMKYSAVKQDFPLGVMLYLHDTAISPSLSLPKMSAASPISSIIPSSSDDTRSVAALNILMREDMAFDVVEEEDALRLSFFHALIDYDRGDGERLSSLQDEQGDGENSVTAPAIDADIQNISSFDTSQAGETNGMAVANDDEATASSDPSLFTMASGGENEILETNNGGGNGSIEPMDSAFQVESTVDALLTGIKFQETAARETAITLSTSTPIEYQLEKSKVNPNELQLSLFDTVIPKDYRKRLVTPFNSVVEALLPVNRFDNDAPSHIIVQLKDHVPYHLLQDGRTLSLVVEPSMDVESDDALRFDPSLLDGAEFGTAQGLYNPQNLKNGTGGVDTLSQNSKSDPFSDALANSSGAVSSDKTGSDDISSMTIDYGIDEEAPVEVKDSFDEASLLGKPKVYTGEKISLDFYETDIKNVFRILRTVSGDNFAIDKDVTGNVTLALDKPVPWDQVLDLILKMNGLGMVQEGSIIRIATLATLQREEQARQDMFEAKKKALEQQKELEPLITEYLRVNYADPVTDIKPHLNEIKTERGKISVDKRSSLIIITDVKQTIEDAKKLIFKLDKVTPQVLISAKVVEATKDFSKEIGITWGAASEDVYRDDMGGLYSFDVAFNYPAASNSSIGYTFNRIAGTPMLLNARLTAAETAGQTKIISSPKIMTLDNKKAKINQGLEIPYDTVSGEAGNSTVTTAFKKIDLMLEVEPSVTPDRRVNMKIKITKNDLAGFTSSGEPTVSTNEAETELLINDGETIVIGGVVKNTVSEAKEGFPYLADIPYLGHLFRSDTEQDVRNELLIFITPSIVDLEQKTNLL